MINILNNASRIFKRNPNRALSQVSGAVNEGLNQALVDLDLLELQFRISTATGTWLDEWGSWFNIHRASLEDDTAYRARILSTVTTSKNTIPAIRRLVATYLSSFYSVVVTPEEVSIYEPYVNIMKYSESRSAYSTDDKYPDGLFWRTNVIQIVLPYGASTGLKQVMDTIKPAGLRVMYDAQLVPEKQHPEIPGAEPVEFLRPDPTDYMFVERFLKLEGIYGFFNPFMEIQKYSGTRSLNHLYMPDLHLVNIVYPYILNDHGEMIRDLFIYWRIYYDILPDPYYALSFYLEALGDDGIGTYNADKHNITIVTPPLDPYVITPEDYMDMIVCPSLAPYVITPVDNTIVQFYAEPQISMGQVGLNDYLTFYLPKADLITVSTTPHNIVEATPTVTGTRVLMNIDQIKQIEVSPIDLEFGGQIPTYEHSVIPHINYNDEEFAIRLGSTALIADIGDIPLIQQTPVMGGAEIIKI